MRPRDEVKRDLVWQWLAKADEDLGVARHLIAEDTPYLGAVGFHAQQAAEKYLKAFLVQHEIDFPKTHNIGVLLDLVGGVDRRLAVSLSHLTVLTPYGVAVRYPVDRPDMTHQAAKQASELAAEAQKEIVNALHGCL